MFQVLSLSFCVECQTIRGTQAESYKHLVFHEAEELTRKLITKWGIKKIMKILYIVHYSTGLMTRFILPNCIGVSLSFSFQRSGMQNFADIKTMCIGLRSTEYLVVCLEPLKK